jgi:hypothetical protein
MGSRCPSALKGRLMQRPIGKIRTRFTYKTGFFSVDDGENEGFSAMQRDFP